MGLSRVNVGAGGQNGLGPSNVSPRGGGGGGANYQYGVSGSNGYNQSSAGGGVSNHQHMMNGVVPRELLNASHNGSSSNSPHNNSNANSFNSNNGMALGSTGHKKHRGNSRQSGNKSSRRHHNRYVDTNSGSGGGGGTSGGDNPNNRYSGHQQPPSHAAGSYGSGPGASSSYHAHPHAPSPGSTMQVSSSNTTGDGHHHHHAQHQQQQHQPQQHQHGNVLPHISGAGSNTSTMLLSSGILAPGPGSKNNSMNNMLGGTGGGTGGRNSYLSSMNSPPSPAMNAVTNASSAAAYSISAAPVVREFQSGNVLTNTEEHSHSAVTSIRGMKPGNPNWINQDNFFVTENFEGRDIRIYCVLDGHGEHGHLVSRRCREMFPQFIKSARMDIDGAFNMMQNDLNSASDMDVRCSGATCVMATLMGGKLSVYNCGDSRAVLGRRNPNGSIYAMAMSKDHKPDRADERKRILSCGGHLGCRQVLVNQPGRGPVSMPVGPCRVWYQHRGETLGLAMSRSLGDSIVHKSGVSAEPECIERVIDDYDDFLILATDGVWDVVDNNYAVQLVQSFAIKSANWSAIEATNSITRFARSRWEKLSPMIDDISCIVVKIHR